MPVQFRVLGVDPGISGAVVLYTPRTGEIEAKRDFVGVKDVARAVHQLGRRATFAVLEFVSARPGQGVTSMFNFGKATGVPVGVMESLGLPWIDVTPQKWQRWVKEYVGIPEGSPLNACEAALLCAPAAHHRLFDRAKDHNTADAYLLALWGATHADERPYPAGQHGSQTRLPVMEHMIRWQEARERDFRLLEDLKAARGEQQKAPGDEPGALQG